VPLCDSHTRIDREASSAWLAAVRIAGKLGTMVLSCLPVASTEHSGS
jgi:hypothetical protein